MAQRVLGIWRKSFFSAKENLKLTPEQLKITKLEKRLKDAELEIIQLLKHVVIKLSTKMKLN